MHIVDKRVRNLLLFSASVLFGAHSAAADCYDPIRSGFSGRRDFERSAYQAGLWNGSLTAHEVRELSRERRAIIEDRARFELDGRLTFAEKRILDRERARYDRELSHELRDAERRW